MPAGVGARAPACAFLPAKSQRCCFSTQTREDGWPEQFLSHPSSRVLLLEGQADGEGISANAIARDPAACAYLRSLPLPLRGEPGSPDPSRAGRCQQPPGFSEWQAAAPGWRRGV